MSRIRSTDTGIEVRVRRALHARGYRFRLHVKDLPGRPDIVLPKHRAVIFVNGCFWHSHGCRLSTKPSSNREFWERKLQGTVIRDAANHDELRRLGWRVFVIWECDLGRGADDHTELVIKQLEQDLRASAD